MSRDSGAGAYAHSAGTGARSCFRSRSVKSEVVRTLITAGFFLADLHQDVVEERRGAEAVQIRRQPVGAEGLVHEHEVLDGLFRRPDPARRLEADHAAGLVVDV